MRQTKGIRVAGCRKAGFKEASRHPPNCRLMALEAGSRGTRRLRGVQEQGLGQQGFPPPSCRQRARGAGGEAARGVREAREAGSERAGFRKARSVVDGLCGLTYSSGLDYNP